MSSRSTLIFLCDDPKLYGNFIAQFRFAGCQISLARNLAQAQSQLIRRQTDAIVIRHDCVTDDRALASKLKRIAPEVPIFLVTDREQPGKQPDITAVWRGDLTDDVVARAMAVFFDSYLAPRSGKGALGPLASDHPSVLQLQPRPLG